MPNRNASFKSLFRFQIYCITAECRARETRSLTQLEMISAEKTLEFVLFDIHLVGRQCRDFKLD
jgi:hypothetical protein